MVQKTQIDTILIANRGEIASRIIRSCKKMGIRTIAIFSDVDKDLLFVHQADTAIHIGDSEPSNSYLNQDKIIRIAKSYGANAIHPAYGFLSENADFAKKCQQEGLIFIGPNVNAIKAMGSKSAAKSLMKEHGVPVIPGYQGTDQSVETIAQEAQKIGFPVLLKATAGGGGKGMRIVSNEADISKAVEAVKREALNAFGNDDLIVEKFIAKGRHIEFQIFGDQHGNVIHILERECSIQRRYQKIIEESPSPIMTNVIRQKMGQSAIEAAKALQYDNAGTVEFIFDDSNGQYYFLEVNTRLQVEHPVTEEITGIDLVQMQIESAQGIPLSLKQEDIIGKGYAIEVRLYSENPYNDFLPASGTILKWEVPQVEGLRVETAIKTGDEISIYYDPMIAKLIVWGANRRVALRKMKYTLRHLVCLGITTNQDFLLDIVQKEAFLLGDYDTHFIHKHYAGIQAPEESQDKVDRSLIAATLFHWNLRQSKRILLSGLPSGWRNNFYQAQQVSYLVQSKEIQLQYRVNGNVFEIQIEDRTYHATIIKVYSSKITYQLDQERLSFDFTQTENQVFTHNEQIGNLQFKLKDRFPSKETEKMHGAYVAPMPSQVIKVLVKAGDHITKGDDLIVLSSMKMENRILATESGKVTDVLVSEGMNIKANQMLLKIEEKN